MICRAGSACWDTTLHNSDLLTTNASTEGGAIPVHFTVCLDNCDPPSHRLEARGTISIIIKGSPAVDR